MIRLWITIICAGMLIGFGNDKPKAESFAAMHVLPISSIHIKQSTAIETMMYEGKIEEFIVQHHVIGNNVYIECYIPNFSFRKDSNVQNRGYINLYVDNKKIDKITTAAFIVKGVPLGNHNIRLEVENMDSNQTILNKQFQVIIK